MTVSRSKGKIHAAAFACLILLNPALSVPPSLSAWVAQQAARSASLPDRLSDADFWKLVTDVSEPGGFFRITDNYTSNEREIGQLFTMLRETGVKGGVYLGVGPEQNFTYIAAIRPAMAFIVDIRRQAVMQHLMFKAVFELTKDRSDFISLLFSRQRPAGLDATTPIQRIWDAYSMVGLDEAGASKNYARIVDHLTVKHKFTFTEEETEQLRSVFLAFMGHGPAISTRGMSVGRGSVTFADLTGWSYDASGEAQSFLTTEDNFRYVKTLHERNLIVPVSGDFGGPKTIRAIGAYLAKRNGIVSAFYVSNVEQYLFQDGKQKAFYENVSTLPVNGASVFIRPYSLRRGGGPAQSLCGIAKFITAVGAGQIYSNNDALACALR
jgi:hypothetical protein